MTVALQQTVFTYTAAGGTVFAYGCRILDDDDLVVSVDSIVKTKAVDYTVTGVLAPAGGIVTFLVAPVNGAVVRLFRQTRAERLTDYQTSGDFQAATVNPDFDRAIMIVQDMIGGSVEIANSLRVPAGEAVNVLPIAAARASKVLAFDSLGQPVALVGVDAGSAAALDLSLRSSVLNTAGAGQVGFGYGLAYGVGTIGKWLNDLVGSAGAAFLGWIRAATGAVATTLDKILSWRTFNAFEFMSAAQIADVQANTVTLDVSAAWQACITAAAGRKIKAGAGTHRVNTALTYNTSGNVPGLKIIGEGVGKTIFDNRVANGTMLTLDGSGTALQFAKNGLLDGFSVVQGAVVAASRGITLKSQWWLTMRNVAITGQSSDGIRLINDNSDSDSSAYCLFENVDLNTNGGWGFNTVPATLAPCALSNLTFLNCRWASGVSGGMQHFGFATKFIGGGFANNAGAGGLVSPYNVTATPSGGLTIDGTEFDGNTGFHLDIPALKQGAVKNCHFVYRANGVGIRIGDGGAGPVYDFLAERNHHFRVAGTVTFHSVGSNANYTKILSNYYPTLTGVTQITDAGVGTYIDQLGQSIQSAVQTFSVSSGVGTVNLNTLNGVFQRVVATAATLTIGIPVGAQDGREIELEVNNSSGGACVYTFDAIWAKSTFAAPANGTSKTGRFRYYATAVKWRQIGAWSTDI